MYAFKYINYLNKICNKYVFCPCQNSKKRKPKEKICPEKLYNSFDIDFKF